MSYSVKLVLVVNQILFKGNPTTLNSFYSLSNPNLTPIFESESNVILCINGHVIQQAEPKLI